MASEQREIRKAQTGFQLHRLPVRSDGEQWENLQAKIRDHQIVYPHQIMYPLFDLLGDTEYFVSPTTEGLRGCII